MVGGHLDAGKEDAAHLKGRYLNLGQIGQAEAGEVDPCPVAALSLYACIGHNCAVLQFLDLYLQLIGIVEHLLKDLESHLIDSHQAGSPFPG